MRKLAVLLLLTAVVALALGPQAGAVTTQTASDVFNGRSYLWLEAESFSSLGADPEDDGWLVVSKETPITAVGGESILPPDSNVSGSALLDRIGGGQQADTAVYEVQFLTAGTYQFYSRHTMFDRNGNGTYGDEDSIFVSPAFNANSSTDWDGFEGLQFDESDLNAEIPNPGYALDSIGFKPDTGDTPREGWFAIRDWNVKSAGVLHAGGNQDPALYNGKFNWYNRPAFVSSNSSGAYDGEYGFKTEYTVSEAQVGQTLTFEISTREAYGVFDGFLFIQDDDVNLLDEYTQEEVDAILASASVPEAGDYDGDGFVGQSDLDLVLLNWGDTAPPAPAGWVNQVPSGLIGQTSLDGVLLNWGNGTAPGIAAVPEPNSLVMLCLGLGLMSRRTRRIG